MEYKENGTTGLVAKKYQEGGNINEADFITIDYENVTSSTPVTISSTTNQTVFTATQHCRVNVISYPASGEGNIDSRNLMLVVNGHDLLTWGNSSSYPANMTAAVLELMPNDVVAARKASSGVVNTRVSLHILPYKE